jgi:hypothetical protein
MSLLDSSSFLMIEYLFGFSKTPPLGGWGVWPGVKLQESGTGGILPLEGPGVQASESGAGETYNSHGYLIWFPSFNRITPIWSR